MYICLKGLVNLNNVVMKLHIKNMVCVRCKMVVISELEKLGLPYSTVELGEADITGDISAEQKMMLRVALKNAGLELMEDSKTILVEKIITTIIELVDSNQGLANRNLSYYLSERLGLNYTYLSNLFSEVKGTTIEKYYLAHKIEKVKELLVYEDMNLTEIAWTMHYSSVAHLSNQFKKMTGLTPSHFKKLKNKRRNLSFH